ncbi:ArnT family glycosyltransferase [Algoriphagus chordae]|uniref:4-amino-4-deoxy-L-arabinose transferase-like glycosyltransferase n=1 Tax=Algoriphagus chordae TaxID=237019 RepID=A0A2W7QDW2_9BACT|nr:glycosyltransferase family 39 protein [Algoriphagus chordae]PZX46373.1 4-amino-4-deoxy-L-arabinose transferase-like glycosyltransferase [Algoriphagus chordae]
MAAFAILVGPFALSFHMHFPDEMYYSDAAVKMLQNGDYLTTYLGNGELRFRKPIGTYWVVLAGFKLFGVSAFASRILFLLAGALTVGATYWLAKLLFDDKKIAGISALVIAANPVLILSATRSIPDVLLGLTMTTSAIGFAGLIRFGDQSPKKYLWLLYISLALAVEIKGIPAVALGGLAILYLLLNPWKKISFKTFIHIPSIAVSVFIALFWFVAMYIIHGPTYLDSFVADQVGSRVTSRHLLILKNGMLAVLILIAIYIPWIFLVLPRFKESVKKTWSENAVFFGFALLWGLAILGMGAMTSKFYERYLLPVAPVLAVLLAWLLVRGGFEMRQRGLKISIWLFLILNIIVWLVGLYINIQLGSTFWIYLQLALGLIILAYLFRLTAKSEKLPKALSYSFLLVFFLVSTVTAKISLPEQGEQVAEFVAANSIDPKDEIGFIGNIHASSKIRVYLGTDFYMTDISGEKKLTDEELLKKSEAYKYLIVEDKHLSILPENEYEIREVSLNWDSKKIPFLLQNLSNPEFHSLLQENGKIYYWLEKKSAQ